jgi:hypothetical protein
VENVHQCIGPEPALRVSKKAEHKEKDHVLAWQLAHDNLAWSHQHSKDRLKN